MDQREERKERARQANRRANRNMTARLMFVLVVFGIAIFLIVPGGIT